MHSVRMVKIYAVLITALAVLGLFVSGHLFGIMNTDPAIDALRVVLAAILLYVGLRARDNNLAHTALLGVGILYVGMALIGLMNSTLGGLLPSGLTGFDIAFHLITGITAVAAGLTRSNHLPAHS